ncbi:ABC transporter ATP-binding protein [uncultured Roseobacter sp.]|uniref:ABC transporter ATP-binding protein n=1 Tax=uncultured Roseobacter sp. TaxID=114847 RepID=UPI00262C26F2|nr:ABC transporter ATP-binding protein [uncultured Roseobacter sp.]
MIRLEDVTKVFGTVTAVDRISLEVPEGQICVLLGPSGCGKTTTMRMINRLIEPTSGRILIGDEDVTQGDPVKLRRRIGYVIQQIGLFPNKTVVDNICTVPDLLGKPRKESRARAAELLEMVALDPELFLNRYPRELSGGQAQRIGVVRALAADPPVMLMDEPFGAIDPINREVIQDEFLRLQRRLGTTVVLVSHDLDEAIKLADQVAILRDGRLMRYAPPAELLADPGDPFVEDFLGRDRALKRLRLGRVGDAMDSAPPRLTLSDTLATARALFAATDAPALVAVGPRGRPRGMISRTAAEAEGAVADHATPVAATARVEDDLRLAVAAMLADGMPLIPCVDSDGVLRGTLGFAAVTAALSEKDTPA